MKTGKEAAPLQKELNDIDKIVNDLEKLLGKYKVSHSTKGVIIDPRLGILADHAIDITLPNLTFYRKLTSFFTAFFYLLIITTSRIARSISNTDLTKAIKKVQALIEPDKTDYHTFRTGLSTLFAFRNLTPEARTLCMFKLLQKDVTWELINDKNIKKALIKFLNSAIFDVNAIKVNITDQQNTPSKLKESSLNDKQKEELTIKYAATKKIIIEALESNYSIVIEILKEAFRDKETYQDLEKVLVNYLSGIPLTEQDYEAMAQLSVKIFEKLNGTTKKIFEVEHLENINSYYLPNLNSDKSSQIEENSLQNNKDESIKDVQESDMQVSEVTPSLKKRTLGSIVKAWITEGGTQQPVELIEDTIEYITLHPNLNQLIKDNANIWANLAYVYAPKEYQELLPPGLLDLINLAPEHIYTLNTFMQEYNAASDGLNQAALILKALDTIISDSGSKKKVKEYLKQNKDVLEKYIYTVTPKEYHELLPPGLSELISMAPQHIGTLNTLMEEYAAVPLDLPEAEYKQIQAVLKAFNNIINSSKHQKGVQKYLNDYKDEIIPYLYQQLNKGSIRKIIRESLHANGLTIEKLVNELITDPSLLNSVVTLFDQYLDFNTEGVRSIKVSTLGAISPIFSPSGRRIVKDVVAAYSPSLGRKANKEEVLSAEKIKETFQKYLNRKLREIDTNIAEEIDFNKIIDKAINLVLKDKDINNLLKNNLLKTAQNEKTLKSTLEIIRFGPIEQLNFAEFRPRALQEVDFKDVEFTGSLFERLTQFNNVSFKDVSFSKKIKLDGAKDINAVSLENAEINGEFEINKSTLKYVTFKNTNIYGELKFDEVELLNIQYAKLTCEDSIKFINSAIQKNDFLEITSTGKFEISESKVNHTTFNTLNINNNFSIEDSDIEEVTFENNTIDNKFTIQKSTLKEVYCGQLKCEEEILINESKLENCNFFQIKSKGKNGVLLKLTDSNLETVTIAKSTFADISILAKELRDHQYLSHFNKVQFLDIISNHQFAFYNIALKECEFNNLNITNKVVIEGRCEFDLASFKNLTRHASKKLDFKGFIEIKATFEEIKPFVGNDFAVIINTQNNTVKIQSKEIEVPLSPDEVKVNEHPKAQQVDKLATNLTYNELEEKPQEVKAPPQKKSWFNLGNLVNVAASVVENTTYNLLTTLSDKAFGTFDDLEIENFEHSIPNSKINRIIDNMNKSGQQL